MLMEPHFAIVTPNEETMNFIDAYLCWKGIPHYTALPNDKDNYHVAVNSNEAPDLVVTTKAASEGHPYKRVGDFYLNPTKANEASRLNYPGYVEIRNLDQLEEFVSAIKVRKIKKVVAENAIPE